MTHKSVLLKEVAEFLNPKSNENFIDATLGAGGHSLEILKKTAPDGKILGIDWNEEAIKNIEKKISVGGGKDENDLRKRLIPVCDNYANLKEIVQRNNFPLANGLLVDLGISSDEIESSGKGFSFLKNEPLDMRYNSDAKLTAFDVINKFRKEDLISIFTSFGEEKFTKRIADRIVEMRDKKQIKTSLELAEIIKGAVPFSAINRGRHPATRVFQSLRIFVNSELDNLQKILEAACDIVLPGGRIAIISFHSLEDRIVKNYFKQLAVEGKIKILTKKPIVPAAEEIKDNPRSRSAKLRVVQLI